MGRKYHNEPVVIDGIKFASRREGRLYSQLKAAQQGGAITNLQLQVPFKLEISGVLIAKYIADFTYREVVSGKEVVVDAKGVRTAVYQLKKKMMRALLGIDVVEM